MESLPKYSKLTGSIGCIVDEFGEQGLYLVDACFFFPVSPFVFFSPKTDDEFKGDFFAIYRSVLLNRKLEESDYAACASVMDEVESYAREYAEFLKTIVDSGLPVRTTTNVRRELMDTVRVYRNFSKQGSSARPKPSSEMLIARKKQMLRRQHDYVKDIRGEGCLSIIERNGLIYPEELRLDPTYSEIENTLLANSYRWTGRRSLKAFTEKANWRLREKE
ncbi:MAG TPA: hypothetical protein VJA47_02475 [archaeon]|nr:hypothetical protein [archaeon]